jgi:hypothetical protein
MFFKEDQFLISPHRRLSVTAPPKKRAAKKVLHPKETIGVRRLYDSMVITGKRLQRRACDRINNSPCLCCSSFIKNLMRFPPPSWKVFIINIAFWRQGMQLERTNRTPTPHPPPRLRSCEKIDLVLFPVIPAKAGIRCVKGIPN